MVISSLEKGSKWCSSPGTAEKGVIYKLEKGSKWCSSPGTAEKRVISSLEVIQIPGGGSLNRHFKTHFITEK